jgi:hypothetical protein
MFMKNGSHAFQGGFGRRRRPCAHALRRDVGEPLGRIGNTGNTGEPHLPIHAQRPGTGDAPLSGEPLPIRFGATYPSRNTRIRALGPT